jgi:hypothetical protein
MIILNLIKSSANKIKDQIKILWKNSLTMILKKLAGPGVLKKSLN